MHIGTLIRYNFVCDACTFPAICQGLISTTHCHDYRAQQVVSQYIFGKPSDIFTINRGEDVACNDAEVTELTASVNRTQHSTHLTLDFDTCHFNWFSTQRCHSQMCCQLVITTFAKKHSAEGVL